MINILILAAGASSSEGDAKDWYPVCISEMDGIPLIERQIQLCNTIRPYKLIVALKDQEIQKFAIGQRDNLVVITHHDERFGFHKRQERRTRPSHHRHQLIEISGFRRRRNAANMLRLVAHHTAVQRLEMLRHEFGVDIAARIGHLGEGGRLGGRPGQRVD